MTIKYFLILGLSLGMLNIWAQSAATAKPADPPLPPEGIVDPMNDLRRSSSKFIDSTELEIVTPQKLYWLLKDRPAAGYFCFTELRDKEIRRSDSIPLIWADRPISERNILVASAQPGEYYPWQLGIYAPYKALYNVRLKFGDLTNEKGEKIGANAIQCFNRGGIGQDGKRFTRRIDIPQGTLQVLWSGIDIPKTASGTYRGKASLEADGAEPTIIDITLKVSGPVLENGGRNDSWRKSRMSWLNSTIGFAETPTAPYTPLTRDGLTINYLGGSVTLSPEGLPAEIVTHYDQANQLDPQITNRVLAEPITFVVETSQGIEKLKPSPIDFIKETPACLQWQVELQGEDVTVNCLAEMQFDGSIEYQMKVIADKSVEIKDIRAVFDYTDYASKYVMGLGMKGGQCPDSTVDWKWNTMLQQDRIWLGNVNAGLQIVLKDTNYKRPLVNIYYHFGRLNYPIS